MKKKAGRPKGSKGSLKRYLDYLCNAKKIESDLKITYIKDGQKKVDRRNIILEAKVDIGHELLITMISKGLKGDNVALSMYLNRRYGRVGLTKDEEDLKTKGLIVQAINEMFLD